MKKDPADRGAITELAGAYFRFPIIFHTFLDKNSWKSDIEKIKKYFFLMYIFQTH